MFKDSLEKQQKRYDKTWRKGLENGKEQRGNLYANLDFLNQNELLKPESSILEIGCGIGTVVYELSQKGFNAIGTDISTEAVEYGLKKYPGIRLEVQAAEKLSYEDEKFDVVLSFDLFEHIKEIDRHISEVRRVLCPGGYYLFETPNKYSNATFETLRSRSLAWRQAHPSLHTPRQIKHRFRRHGFDVEFVKINSINEFTLKKIERFGPLAYVMKRLDFRRLPLCLQTNLYVIAKKKSKN